MEDCEFFGEVWNRRGREKMPRKPTPPSTPIGKFYAKHSNEIITHWCKQCRRWHGPSCFYNLPKG